MILPIAAALTLVTATEVAAVVAQIAPIGSQVLTVRAYFSLVGANIRPILRDILAVRSNVVAVCPNVGLSREMSAWLFIPSRLSA